VGERIAEKVVLRYSDCYVLGFDSCTDIKMVSKRGMLENTSPFCLPCFSSETKLFFSSRERSGWIVVGQSVFFIHDELNVRTANWRSVCSQNEHNIKLRIRKPPCMI